MNTQEPTRIPRPMGLTMLSKEYQENNSETNQLRLRRHLINQYTLTGFRYNGEPISINNLALLTNIPIQEINNLIAESGKSLGAFNSPEQVQDTITSIISLSTNWAIQDKGLINQQIELLAKAQGGTYKPFISGELNKALKTGLDANKNLMEIYRTFFTSSTTNILNIYGNNEDQGDRDMLTPDQAFEIVNKSLPTPSSKQLPNPNNLNAIQGTSINEQDRYKINDQAVSSDDLDKLFEDHNLGDCPEVRELRSGKASLQKVSRPPSQSTEEPNSLITRESISLKAVRKVNSNHSNYDRRRGFDVEDIDAIEGPSS